MRIKYTSLILAIIVLSGYFVGPTQATLITIGSASYSSSSYNLIYDNGSPFGPIVWLDYDHTYGTWSDQASWIASLNGAGSLAYNLDSRYSVTWDSDWRLPYTENVPWSWGFDGTTSSGFNITSSEMGHLFYAELGFRGEYATDGSYLGEFLNGKPDPFENFTNAYHWSSTDSLDYPDAAWAFSFHDGRQDIYTKEKQGTFNPRGLAVRSVQVEALPVPEPSTVFTLGSGLVCLAWCRRKRKKVSETCYIGRSEATPVAWTGWRRKKGGKPSLLCRQLDCRTDIHLRAESTA